jgi:hypothetical protein
MVDSTRLFWRQNRVAARCSAALVYNFRFVAVLIALKNIESIETIEGYVSKLQPPHRPAHESFF